MKKFLALAAMAVMGASFASADTLFATLNCTGVDSYDNQGSPNNVAGLFDMQATFGNAYTGFTLTGIGWDVDISTVGNSWLSEAVVYFDNDTLSDGVFLTPGFSDSFSGSATYSSGGIVDLVGLGLDINLAPTDMMYVEFFDSFDDNPNAVDAHWGGTIDLQFEATAVPEPATMAILGLGVAAVAAKRRRKNA